MADLQEQAGMMASRIGGTPGGLRPPPGQPPPPQAGQQPPGVTPPIGGQSKVAPLLDQVKMIVLEGNQADLAAVGDFVSWLMALSQAHQGGQGAPATPMQGMPQQGTPPMPTR
jgi:hypothetical protein